MLVQCKGVTLKGVRCCNKSRDGDYCKKHTDQSVKIQDKIELSSSEEGKQYVYILRCIRFYGQLEGIFLTLQEMEDYLSTHPKQPRLPYNAFDKVKGRKDYWESETSGIYYSNYYFYIRRVEYLGLLDSSKTWLNDDSGYYVLFQNGGTAIMASNDETALQKIGLKNVFKWVNGFPSGCHHYNEKGENVYDKTDQDWISKVLNKQFKHSFSMDEIVDGLLAEEVDKVWDARIKGDSWSKKYYILEITG